MNKKVLTFYLGNELYGIDITMVKEISRKVEYSRIPDVNESIVGILNLRGQIVTLFDLFLIIKKQKTLLKETDSVPCIILKPIENSVDQVGFIIDKSGEVIEIDEEDCEKTPANLNSDGDDNIETVVKLKNKLLMMINAKNIFSVEKYQ